MKNIISIILGTILLTSGCSSLHRDGTIKFSEGDDAPLACTDAVTPKSGVIYSVFHNQCTQAPLNLKKGNYENKVCEKKLLGKATIIKIVDAHYAKIKAVDAIDFHDDHVLTLE